MQQSTHAISIRQPYVGLTLRGVKRAEYRSHPTNIRGHVYLYASLQRTEEPTVSLPAAAVLHL
jgi:hypothetical protein